MKKYSIPHVFDSIISTQNVQTLDEETNRGSHNLNQLPHEQFKEEAHDRDDSRQD